MEGTYVLHIVHNFCLLEVIFYLSGISFFPVFKESINRVPSQNTGKYICTSNGIKVKNITDILLKTPKIKINVFLTMLLEISPTFEYYNI